MKIFMTGATGCAGQWLIKALLDAGHELVLLTRNPSKYPGLLKENTVSLVAGTYTDWDVIEAGMQGCDAVIQMGLNFALNPVQAVCEEILTTAHMLELARKAGVGQYIFTSTVATSYKDYHDLTEKSFMRPMGMYGACKNADEKIVLGFDAYEEDGKLSPVTMRRNVIRLTNVYMVPAFEGASSIPDKRYRNYARQMLRGEDVIIPKDMLFGEQFESGRQLSRLFLKVLESDCNEEIFYNTSTRFIRWEEILTRMRDMITGCNSQIHDESEWRDDALYSPRKMEEMFGIRFDGDEDLDEFLMYEIEEARKELEP